MSNEEPWWYVLLTFLTMCLALVAIVAAAVIGGR